MINPDLSNFRPIFGDNFFPEIVTKKYDKYLFHKNYPFKTMEAYFYETIQNVSVPGVNLQTIAVNALQNLGKSGGQIPGYGVPNSTINRVYPGTASENDTIDGVTINITFRNTILNWMYCYEMLKLYYRRTRTIKDFYFILEMRDSADIPMIHFKLSDCFISMMPGLEFAFNQSFSESKTFDIGFTFNQLDVLFVVPGFNLEEINL